MDEFDRIPDAILLLIFNRIEDFKTLCRCCAVSRRFNDLATQVENVVLMVDDRLMRSAARGKNRSPVLGLICEMKKDIWMDTRNVFSFTGTESLSIPDFKKFLEIRVLKIELPSGRFGRTMIDNNSVFLKWKAEFESGFRKCVVLLASANVRRNRRKRVAPTARVNNSNGIRRRWSILNTVVYGLAFFEEETRKYLRKLVVENTKLHSVVLTDPNGGCVVSIAGLRELEVFSPDMGLSDDALIRRYRRVDELSLVNGPVLKEVMLAVVWNKEQSATCELADTFDEPYEDCLRKLVPMESDGLQYTRHFS